MSEQVDARVLQQQRAKLSWEYETRLKKILKLTRRIQGRPTTMGMNDIEDLCKIHDLADFKR